MTSQQPKAISIPEVVPQIHKPWSPKLLGNVNNEYDFKIARLRGSYIWHAHQDTDELFHIVSGSLNMRLKEPGNADTAHLEDVVLNAGDVFVIPAGMRHCPAAIGDEDVIAIMIEKAGTLNSGDAQKIEGLTNEVEDFRAR